MVGVAADTGPSADRLPPAGPHQRLRWDLPALGADLAADRIEAGWTWSSLAAELGCTTGRLTHLRTARDADMDLVMRVLRRLGGPSVRYIRAVDR